MNAFPEEDLSALETRGLLRRLRALPATGGKFEWEGREILNFSSNDYLDLANDPRLKRAACDAVEHWGCGATASRLMTGHLDLHQALEDALAQWTGQEAALAMGSGFLTNLGVLTAMTDRHDVLFTDKLNHASLIDGARLSQARVVRYRHNDPEHLHTMLERTPCEGRRWVVTDSVFSMDGDRAPLREIHGVAERFDAAMIVDEAHAMGLMGEQGGGLCRSPEVDIRPAIVVGTFSKSLGSYGGFVACSRPLRDWLVNRARSFIYSTGLPPATVASTLEAVNIIRADASLASELASRAQQLHHMLSDAGLAMPACESQILPIVIGDNQTALDLAQDLGDEGILATAVRPPTVPEGTARLRLSVTLAHEEKDLRRLVETLLRAMKAREIRA